MSQIDDLDAELGRTYFELDTAKLEIQRLESVCAGLGTAIQEEINKNNAYRAQLADCEAVLAKYANEDNWDDHDRWLAFNEWGYQPAAAYFAKYHREPRP